MKKTLSALTFLIAVSTAPLAAQERTEPAYDKDGGTATLLSVLVTGGGQMYAGETTKGLMLLGGAIGSVVAGAALSSYEEECDPNNCDQVWDYTPLQIGTLAALGFWVYGIVDADDSVERMRAKSASLPAVLPTLAEGADGSTRVGVSVRF